MKNNQPLSESAMPAFRELIAAANPDVDSALSTSHHGVARYLMRLYECIRPRVIKDLSEALSEIHITLTAARQRAASTTSWVSLPAT